VACFEPGAAESVRYPNAPAGLIFGGSDHDAGCPNAGIFANYGNYGPRFGFAYQVSEKGDRSIRGGHVSIVSEIRNRLSSRMDGNAAGREKSIDWRYDTTQYFE
jgi:hypothetical protein